jgi:PAS domain S-box-containing protein
MESDAIFLIRNSDGQIFEVNTAGVKLYGFSREELLKMKNADLSAEPDETRKATLKRKREVPTRYHKKKDGTVFPVEITANHFTWRGEEVHIASIRDIAKRKQAEEALRESETKFRLLFENANDAIFIIQDGIVKFPNRKTEEMTGYSGDELSKIPFINLILPEDRDFVLERRRKRLMGEKPPSTYSFRMINKSGSELLVQINTVLITWEGKPATINFIRDISEQKRLEAQLQQAQKMESVGLLAGGVAHDLNNVLSGIVSYPELLLLDLPEDSKLRKPIETMQESGHRAAAIVQDLLTVARGVATTKEPLNLNDLVSDYLNSPEFNKLKQFHPTVTIKSNLNSNLLNITGSHVHIGKVIMNLVSNASEAIEGSGNVIISTMNRYIDRPLRGYDDVTVGEYAVLAVSDDGSGIPSGDLERIFDPFYTKKVLGRSGTGLGLTVVWNVVQDHEGYIDVKSDENGTIFELYFSITRDEISDKDLSIPIKDYKGNGEMILVVDDVESQREISCKMLDTLGYKTKAVSSGEEAIEYLKENTVDLILLDMIMDPGINGRETYEQIIKVHPNQKAIITSGFAETADVKATQKLGAGQYIKKPLTLEKIGIAVKDELKK